jgi:hypothetical protein
MALLELGKGDVDIDRDILVGVVELEELLFAGKNWRRAESGICVHNNESG